MKRKTIKGFENWTMESIIPTLKTYIEMEDSVDHDIRILGEEFGIKWGRVEEAFEEDQGSCRAVEPMMMVSIVTI
jgi:hypothetical protein